MRTNFSRFVSFFAAILFSPFTCDENYYIIFAAKPSIARNIILQIFVKSFTPGMSRVSVSTSFFLCRYAFSPPFPLDPRHKEIDDALLPLGGDLDPARDFPPLREAVAAATGTGVLRLENRMTAHRSLLAVVWRFGGREACAYEILAVTTDRVDAFLGDALPIRCRQVKPGTELRLRQS